MEVHIIELENKLVDKRLPENILVQLISKQFRPDVTILMLSAANIDNTDTALSFINKLQDAECRQATKAEFKWFGREEIKQYDRPVTFRHRK